MPFAKTYFVGVTTGVYHDQIYYTLVTCVKGKDYQVYRTDSEIMNLSTVMMNTFKNIKLPVLEKPAIKWFSRSSTRDTEINVYFQKLVEDIGQQELQYNSELFAFLCVADLAPEMSLKLISLTGSVNYDFTARFTVIGPSGVGKSCLLQKFIKGTFSECPATTGILVDKKYVTIMNTRIKLECVDTAGQKKYHNLASRYYENAVAVFIVIDITQPNSLRDLHYWFQQVKDYASRYARVIVLGNKVDMQNKRLIGIAEATLEANKYGADYMEVSAKIGTNVSEAFVAMAKKLYWSTICSKKDAIIKSISLIKKSLKCEAEMCTIQNKKNIIVSVSLTQQHITITRPGGFFQSASSKNYTWEDILKIQIDKLRPEIFMFTLKDGIFYLHICSPEVFTDILMWAKKGPIESSNICMDFNSLYTKKCELANITALDLKDSTDSNGVLNLRSIPIVQYKQLFEALMWCNTVQALDISDNINTECMNMLLHTLKHNKTIKRLYLKCNGFCRDEGRLVGHFLNTNSSLELLHLSQNNLGLDGGRSIANALATNCTLTELDLSYNNFPKVVLKEFLVSLEKNTDHSLQVFELEENHFSKTITELQEIQQLLKPRTSEMVYSTNKPTDLESTISWIKSDSVRDGGLKSLADATLEGAHMATILKLDSKFHDYLCTMIFDFPISQESIAPMSWVLTILSNFTDDIQFQRNAPLMAIAAQTALKWMDTRICDQCCNTIALFIKLTEDHPLFVDTVADVLRIWCTSNNSIQLQLSKPIEELILVSYQSEVLMRALLNNGAIGILQDLHLSIATCTAIYEIFEYSKSVPQLVTINGELIANFLSKVAQEGSRDALSLMIKFASVKNKLWDICKALVRLANQFKFTQAIIDLGGLRTLLQLCSYDNFEATEKLQFVVCKPILAKVDFNETDKSIGSGATGKIYPARIEGRDSVVVKKFKSCDSIFMFREVVFLSMVPPHPNVVEFYGHFNIGTSDYFVLKKYESSLLEFIMKNKPIKPSKKLELAIQVCKGLEVLHSHGMVHTDIKSANFLVRHENKKLCVVISDFGTILGKPLQITETGTVGTLLYSAPEIVLKIKHEIPVDTSSDIYSLGYVLWEIYNWRSMEDTLKFESHTQLINHLQDKKEKNGLPLELPEGGTWNEIIKQCWKIDPAQRPNINNILIALENMKCIVF